MVKKSAQIDASGLGEPTTASAKLEQAQVAAALRKVVMKETLNRQEQQALKRHEKEKEERLRQQYYRSIPQKHWRAMSGRQTKVLNEQAQRYGLPFGGPTLDLTKLAPALHDFLAKNALKLARDEDDLMNGAGSPALERYREERAAIARLDRRKMEGELQPRHEVREMMGTVASILRGAGDALTQQFGPAAAEILHEALNDAQRHVDRSYGKEANHGTSNAA